MPAVNLGISANDVAISADSSLIYAAGRWSDPFLVVPVGDGNLRVYDSATGALLHTYAIGTRLGAMDISPDGSFALITELSPATPGIATVYKVDLATGTFQTFNFTPTDGEAPPFYDVAILDDGVAVLTLNYSGSGNIVVKVLDLADGTFSDSDVWVGQNSFLTPSPDGTQVLVGFANQSDAPTYVVRSDGEFIGIHDGYEDGVMNFNRGIQALDTNTGMVAQFVGNNGLHIYDGNLNYQIDLSDLNPSWAVDVDAVAFDPTGQYLFVLLDSGQEIVQLSTSNWAVVQTIEVGEQPAYRDDFGGRLVISPDGSFLTVVTASNTIRIDGIAVQPTIPATSGADTLNGTTATDVIDGGLGNDAIVGDAGRDMLNGGGGNDTITGGDDDDVIDGGSGDDSINGGAGNDTASFASAASGVSVNLAITTAQNTGGAGIDSMAAIENLYGSAFGDMLRGDGGANSLRGQAGNDLLVGGAGNDWLNGGAGVDTVDYSQETGSATGVMVNLSINTIGSVLGTVGPNEALDTFGNIDQLSSIEHVVTGGGNDVVIGSGGGELIETGAGNDTIRGNGGDDILLGGAGNDIYSSVVQGDIIVELSNEGTDQITTAAASFTLLGYANVENLRGLATTGQTLAGNEISNQIIGNIGNDSIYGGDGADFLFGFGGDDVLVGGTGADLMNGGLGNDRFYIDNAADTLVEVANGGDDIAFVLGTYTLAQGVSVETLYALNQAGTEELTLTGNEFGQSLYGNLGNNYLNGGQGADYLVGLAGNDSLLGGTGNDHMQGGTGNDIYYVDSQGDLVTELAGEGDNDLLVATVSYALGAGASIETMSAEQTSANINLTGNELAQSIYGNDGNNIITGGGGADYLVGGNGNDRYYVDTSDFIAEVNGGDDWIFVADSYILREGNEIETLVAVNQDSTDPVNLTGNEYGQSLYGSQGVNSLNGGAGNDYLVGLGGNDFLIGGAGNDNLDGGQGNDIYYVDGGDQIFEATGQGEDIAVAFASFTLNAGASVETLSAAEGTSAINLTGNELAQSLYGNAGANVLNGGGGNDYLIGGAGNDRFVFTANPGNDAIADFTSGSDKIDLSAFGITITDVHTTSANGTTTLAIDTNHDGTADFTITLVGAGAPTAGDYLF